MFYRRGAETQRFLKAVLKFGASVPLWLILVFVLATAACSVPNLEEPECTEARNVVREFYSFHFGNDLAFADDDLDKRKQYLTPRFFESLRYPPRDIPPGVDPFTRNDHDPPKAFRVGECRVVDPSKRAEFTVLLFWKDNERSEQRSVHAEAVNENEKWLIDRVKP